MLERSLRLWMQQHAPVAPKLRRVRLIDRPTSTSETTAAIAAAPQMSVTTPDGFRIDGLTIESAMAILERLR